jgi:hypothetical protein
MGEMGMDDMQFFIMKWLKVDDNTLRSAQLIQIKNALLEFSPHLKNGITDKRYNTQKNEEKLDDDLSRALLNLEENQLISVDRQAEYIFDNSGIPKITKYGLTKFGMASLKYAEVYGRFRNADINSLNCALEYFSPYTSLDFDKIQSILKELQIGFDIGIISSFLLTSGFCEIKNNQIYLTEKGRVLRREGKLHLYAKYEKEQKLKEKERVDRQDEFIKYQADNARWQRRWGNKFIIASIFISIASMIASASIALYLNKREKPIENKIEIKIDSSLFNNTRKDAKGSGDKRNGYDSGKVDIVKVK